VGEKAITDIGNNVTIEFNNMNFGENGPDKILLCGHSPIPVNTIHIRFFREDGLEVSHMVEFPQSDDYQTLTFPIHEFTGKGNVNFIFMPGSKFDFDWFQFQ
jgi:beta-galactosidase